LATATVVDVPAAADPDLTRCAALPGLDDQQIATRLVRNAARTNAGIGAVGGGVSAIEWAAPPTLLTQPVLLAAETVAVVAIEIKLIGELQELYGQSVPGGQGQRAITLLQAWAGRRGVNLLIPARSRRSSARRPGASCATGFARRLGATSPSGPCSPGPPGYPQPSLYPEAGREVRKIWPPGSTSFPRAPGFARSRRRGQLVTGGASCRTSGGVIRVGQVDPDPRAIHGAG
jgi:hypothetical protein